MHVLDRLYHAYLPQRLHPGQLMRLHAEMLSVGSGAERVKSETLPSSQREQTLQWASQHKVPHSQSPGPADPLPWKQRPLRSVSLSRSASKNSTPLPGGGLHPKWHQAGGGGGGHIAPISAAALTWAISCHSAQLSITDRIQSRFMVVLIPRLVSTLRSFFKNLRLLYESNNWKAAWKARVRSPFPLLASASLFALRATNRWSVTFGTFDSIHTPVFCKLK